MDGVAHMGQTWKERWAFNKKTWGQILAPWFTSFVTLKHRSNFLFCNLGIVMPPLRGHWAGEMKERCWSVHHRVWHIGKSCCIWIWGIKYWPHPAPERSAHTPEWGTVSNRDYELQSQGELLLTPTSPSHWFLFLSAHSPASVCSGKANEF